MASSDFDARTESFLSWFKALPGATFSDALQIVDLRSRGAGRGIVATQDLAPDTTLFTIPRNAIINAETSEVAHKLPQGLKVDDTNEAPRKDSWSTLILIMIYEFLRGQESRWKPYFDVLPGTFETPMFWSDEETSELQASALRSKIGKANAEEMFRENILPVIRQNPDFFPSSREKSDEDLVALAHRMGSTIMAYAFDLENEEYKEEEEDAPDGWVEDQEEKTMMGMVPMADILNADAEFNAHVNHGDDSLSVVSLRPIKAGEEVLNYYGPHPNSELLRRYGYVTERHARHDVVEVPWTVIEASLKQELGVSDEVLHKVRARIEEEEDVEDTFVLEREPAEPNPDGTFAGPPGSISMPEDLTEQLKLFIKGIKKLDPDSIPEKRKRHDVMEAVLANSVATIASRYPTTLTEDESLLRQQDISDRRKMAIIVRIGEKLLLQEAMAMLGGGSSEPGKRAKISE